MPRSLTDAALASIDREHSQVHNLIYMDLPDNRMFLAVDSTQDIDFQRPSGPLVDTVAKTWTGTGGAIVPGTAEESSDVDSGGQDIQFAAVDPDFELGKILLTARPFNRDYQHWRVHINTVGANAGQVASSYLVFHGKMNGRFTIDDQVPEELAEPGTIIVRFRAMSPLGMLDVKRSIKTNLRSHQKWYPDDLGMQYVEQIASEPIFWGVSKPEER